MSHPEEALHWSNHVFPSPNDFQLMVLSYLRNNMGLNLPENTNLMEKLWFTEDLAIKDVHIGILNLSKLISRKIWVTFFNFQILKTGKEQAFGHWYKTMNMYFPDCMLPQTFFHPYLVSIFFQKKNSYLFFFFIFRYLWWFICSWSLRTTILSTLLYKIIIQTMVSKNCSCSSNFRFIRWARNSIWRTNSFMWCQTRAFWNFWHWQSEIFRLGLCISETLLR